jgi:hypothetical protein
VDREIRAASSRRARLLAHARVVRRLADRIAP